MDEEHAANILRWAIQNKQAAELLTRLFEGDAVTFDPFEQRLVFLSADLLKGAIGE